MLVSVESHYCLSAVVDVLIVQNEARYSETFFPTDGSNARLQSRTDRQLRNLFSHTGCSSYCPVVETISKADVWCLRTFNFNCSGPGLVVLPVNNFHPSANLDKASLKHFTVITKVSFIRFQCSAFCAILIRRFLGTFLSFDSFLTGFWHSRRFLKLWSLVWIKEIKQCFLTSRLWLW